MSVIEINCSKCGDGLDIKMSVDVIKVNICDSCKQDIDNKNLQIVEEKNIIIDSLEEEIEKLKGELVDIFRITKAYELNHFDDLNVINIK